MTRDRVSEFAAQQSWIAPIEQPLQDAIHAVFDTLGDARPAVRNALHGTWLHEPLHAVLTDVPIGSWTAAVAFDSLAALGADSRLNTAADAAVAVGVVGAVGAAITGLNDWADVTTETPRRIGAVHALLNVAGLALFSASWCARRKRGCRSSGRALAALGYLVMSVSAHLGGSLVYEHGIGVQDKHPLS